MKHPYLFCLSLLALSSCGSSQSQTSSISNLSSTEAVSGTTLEQSLVSSSSMTEETSEDVSIAPKYIGMGIKKSTVKAKIADETIDECDSFILHIYFENPDQYEILSFTINGKKYSSYMFKDGSTLEDILVEITHDKTKSVETFSIDQIKYVDGTEIKDVTVEGEKEIVIEFVKPASITTTIQLYMANRGFSTALSSFVESFNKAHENDDIQINLNMAMDEKAMIESYASNLDNDDISIVIGGMERLSTLLYEEEASFVDFSSLLSPEAYASYLPSYLYESKGSFDGQYLLPMIDSPSICFYDKNEALQYLDESFLSSLPSFHSLMGELESKVAPSLGFGKIAMAVDNPFDLLLHEFDDKNGYLFDKGTFAPSVDEILASSLSQAIKNVNDLDDKDDLLHLKSSYDPYASALIINDEAVFGFATIAGAGYIYNQDLEIGAFPLVNEKGHYAHFTYDIAMHSNIDYNSIQEDLESLVQGISYSLAISTDYLPVRTDVIASEEYQALIEQYVPIYSDVIKMIGNGDISPLINTFGPTYQSVKEVLNGFLYNGFDAASYETLLNDLRPQD